MEAKNSSIAEESEEDEDEKERAVEAGAGDAAPTAQPQESDKVEFQTGLGIVEVQVQAEPPPPSSNSITREFGIGAPDELRDRQDASGHGETLEAAMKKDMQALALATEPTVSPKSTSMQTCRA